MHTSLTGMTAVCLLLAGFTGLLSVRLAGAPQQAKAPAAATDTTPKGPPEFARDVLPIIEDNCLRCHSAAVQKGELVLDTHEDLMRGGENGTILTPGNAAASRVVQMIQAEVEPKMPPKSTLRPEEIATFKAWIEAGARNSAPEPSASRVARLQARIPTIASEVPARPAVNALAFSPDGAELAVPGYGEVRRVAAVAAAAARAGTGAVAGAAPAAHTAREPLSGAVDLVRSVAYSRDGEWIAGAGGIPGAFGEVLLWNAATGELGHELKGHRDYVYQAVFNRRGTRVATCSYDKTIRVWDIENGRPTHVFREHTEAVYAVAFSPNDRWLASGAGDRSVKIWNLADGARLYTLTEPTDAILTLAFQPPGQPADTRGAGAAATTTPATTKVILSAAGADKTIRTWELTPEGGTQIRSIRAHNAAILRIAYSPDGKWLASSANDHTVKIWETATGKEVRALERQPDWAQGLAWSPDGTRLAVGRFDGTVGIYDVATGRRVSQLTMSDTRPPDTGRDRESSTRKAAQP